MSHPYTLPGLRSQFFGLLALLLLLVGGPALAQTTRYTLQGRVLDASGGTLPGATVLLNGTTAGASTGTDGGYELAVTTAPGPYTLTFSLIGYKAEARTLTLGAAESVTTNVTLTEARQKLDEVVVIGSTVSVNKRELGNAISTVQGAELTRNGSGGVLNALQGKVPGAQITQTSGDPAGAISVRLRGLHSISGSSDPLYVIDGVIISNASTNVSQLNLGNDIGGANPGQNRLADLNPNDIASLNIINGAAAAAIYGSRATNGVVLITTKRGQQGTAQVSAYTSFNINELRKSVPVNTTGKQFGYAGLRLYTIGGVSAAQIAANPGTTTTGITRANVTTQLATNIVDVPRYNYFDEIFRTSYGTDNGVSISGGSERTQYYVSLGYLKNQGIIRGTDFTRYNLRARVDQRLTSWAKVSAGLSYINSFSNEKANGNVFYSPINSINITNNIYDITRRDASGNLLAVEPTRVNPLSTIEDMKFTQGVSRTISDVQLNLTPLKGLSVDYVFGVDAFGQVGQSYIRPYPYQATAGLPAARYPFGFAATGNNAALQLNSDVNVGYEYAFSENLKLNLRAGYNYQYSQQELTTSQGENLTPFITTVSGATSNIRAGYNLERFDLSGYYGQATVGFRNLAFLTGALRRDGSSKFSPSEVNQLYPKISGSLVVSDFNFWQNSAYATAFNSLKLRASYGEAGGLNSIGAYGRFYPIQPSPFLGKNTFTPSSTLANPAVRPERNNELEVGADLAFLRDRITLGVSVYRQKINDLLVRRNLAPSTGGSSITTNVGTMENRGIELALTAVPVKTADFSWDVSVLYSVNRNKVLTLPGGANGLNQTISIDNSAGAPIYLLAGQPVGVFYGTAFARNPDGSLLLTPQGFPQDERTLGQTVGSIDYVPARDGVSGQPSYGPGTVPANVLLGNPNPKWTGSFGTNVTYKKLSLHVLLDAVQGVSVFNADKRTRQGVGLGDLAGQELRGELPRGYIFAIYNTQEFRIDNGSFVKLREAALSYGLPTFTKFISALNLSLVGRNLYSWDKYNGFDPETSAGGASDLVRAIDFGNVPTPRTYQIKLSATF